MTRDQIRSALDRVLGITSPDRMFREIQSSIIRKRANGARPMRVFRGADFNAIGNLFRELRTAAEKSNSRR